MKIALKKGVRGAISQKAALGILIYIHQIHLFIIPVHEEMSKFTEMKVTLEMNSVYCFLSLVDRSVLGVQAEEPDDDLLFMTTTT